MLDRRCLLRLSPHESLHLAFFMWLSAHSFATDLDEMLPVHACFVWLRPRGALIVAVDSVSICVCASVPMAWIIVLGFLMQVNRLAV